MKIPQHIIKAMQQHPIGVHIAETALCELAEIVLASSQTQPKNEGNKIRHPVTQKQYTDITDYLATRNPAFVDEVREHLAAMQLSEARAFAAELLRLEILDKVKTS